MKNIIALAISIITMITNALPGEVNSPEGAFENEYVICSVDATAVGFSDIIEPTEMDFNGENCAELIVKLLSDNGYEPIYEGDTSENFYLSAISGIETDNLYVSEELIPFLQENDVDYEERVSVSNTLGEFDFTDSAGWMYIVNGEIPNVGMNSYIPRPGDEVRLVFTLYYGEDLDVIY